MSRDNDKSSEPSTAKGKGDGPRYFINIEGTVHEWDQETITVAQIRELGGLPNNMPVIEIDLKTNTDRELQETEIVQIRPGMGYSKKVSFKRGQSYGYRPC